MRIGFELNERQLEVYSNWIKELQATRGKDLDEACEEDCCCSSPVTWTYYSTGLGPSIKATCLKEEVDFSIDDDNLGYWPERFGRKYA